MKLNMELFSRVTLKDKIFLARQLAVMLGAGLPIDQAFKIINLQTKKQILKRTYNQILKDLEAGESLSFAISKHRRVFDPVFIAIVRSGESTGQIDKVLGQLADRMEITYDFNSKLRGALIYPIFVVVVMLVIVYLMMIFVVPSLTEVFADLGSELPWTTRAIIAVSRFSQKFWWVELIIFAFIGVGLFFYFRSKSGGSAWDRFKIKCPGVKELFIMAYMARFSRTMAILIKAGIPIMETLAVTADILQNRIYNNSLRQVAAQVERGIPMSVPLGKDPYFPILVSQMIIVGEQTGKMEVVLDKLAEFYEKEVDGIVKSVASLIEPILIVIIGLGVGFLVFSIIYPIYSIARTGF